MTSLNNYGWNNTLDQLKTTSYFHSLPHGRITVVHRTCYDVIAENGLKSCELSGSLLYGTSDFQRPCTGDWVLFQPFDENKGLIVDILPREHTLYRRKSGTMADKQAIAAYVDKAFIVQSLDANFNPNRVERFLVQIVEAGITPVLVLNKADLDFDRPRVDEAIRHLGRHLPVFVTSIQQPESIHALKASISWGETVVFVGSSGVGKSSLINAPCEKAVLLTSDISDSTGKGRHTSTRREMVLLEGSGILIDTPGVREFGLTVDNPDALADLLDISDLAPSCRFKDCTHTNEPGCAVLEALETGALSRRQYDSYMKLQREEEHFTSSEYEKRQKGKAFSKMVEEVKKQKPPKQ